MPTFWDWARYYFLCTIHILNWYVYWCLLLSQIINKEKEPCIMGLGLSSGS